MAILVENALPSTVPVNRVRERLYEDFNGIMMPELRPVLGNGSTHTPPLGYETAWRIFLGANIEGKLYYVCHIAEHFSTAHAYNCEDSSIPECPVLLWGERFHVKSEDMALIRKAFPPHHFGSVPFQMTLAIFPKSLKDASYDQPSFSALLHGSADAIYTPNYRVIPMMPSGTLSLSFKMHNFPLEFWTHPSRTPVIFTALENEIKKPEPNEDMIKIYQDACDLENKFVGAETVHKENGKKLNGLENKLKSAEKVLKDLTEDNAISAKKRLEVIQKKETEVLHLQEDVKQLKTICETSQSDILKQKAEIDSFKLQNKDSLPHSYVEATFQIAFGTKLSNKTVIYKQYNGETGKFELSQNSEKEVRFQNSVHVPYLSLPTHSVDPSELDGTHGRIGAIGINQVFYHLNGQISRIGLHTVRYLKNGQINTIGDGIGEERVDYLTNGNIRTIGSDYVIYNRSNRIATIGTESVGYIER